MEFSVKINTQDDQLNVWLFELIYTVVLHQGIIRDREL